MQALEQYYRFQEEVLDALGGRVLDRTRTFNGSSGGTFRGLGGVQAAERKLRLWMGMPINDGRLIRPTDSPPEARIVFDWCSIMEEALATRADLRRQQAKVQRYQAELIANRNFLLPQLDLIGLYRWRGYGHDLLGPSNALDPINNAYANLTTGMFQEWQLGFEYSMPLGFRRGYAAVRNAQMHITRERAILEEQERQAIHDLSSAYGDAERAYALMQVAYNRLLAAQEQYKYAYKGFFELGGKVSLELVLDARIRLAEAETSYHRGRVEYAVAVKNVHFEKGSLMQYNGAALVGDGAFCRGARNSIVHRIGTGGEAMPINYALPVPIVPGAEAVEGVNEEGPTEPAPPWQVEAASHEAPETASAASESPRAPLSEAADPVERPGRGEVEPSQNFESPTADSTSETPAAVLPPSPLAPLAPISAAPPRKPERLPVVEPRESSSLFHVDPPPDEATGSTVADDP